MNHILNMTVLGIVSGMISIFWTRVTYRRMIFSFVYEWMLKLDHKQMLKTGKGGGHPLSNFLNCIFCLTPYISLLLSIFYIIEFNPWWLFTLIGIAGGLGSGNFVCEIVYVFRNEAE